MLVPSVKGILVFTVNVHCHGFCVGGGVDGTFAYVQGWLFIYVENFATEFVSEVAAVCFVAIIVVYDIMG